MLGHVMEAYWELPNVKFSRRRFSVFEMQTSVKNTISTLQDGTPLSL